MFKSKLMKITTFTVCMSMLMAIPVFAGSNQGAQSSMNMMNLPNGMQTTPGGIQITPGAMQITPGGMQNGTQTTQGAMQNGMQNGMQNAQSNQLLSSAAQYMVDQGIIKGNSSGSYSMSDKVKRCDMSLMLVRAFNLDTSSGSSANGFSDVSQGSYYYDAVNTIQGLGIAQGDGHNFNPTQNMTLEQAILFVERALDAAGIDYSDVDIEGLFDGRTLSEAATREDVSTILYAVLGDDYVSGAAITNNSADAIDYKSDENTDITFDNGDFYDACTAATDGTLDYVVFSNPSSYLGKLYYGYNSSTDYDGKVSASSKYYYSADTDEVSLSDITFVPSEDLSGTATLSYTGYDTDGNSFKGTVKITINSADDAVADNITYTTDAETALDFDQSDFNDACKDATDGSLDYIKFTSLSSNATLYYGYDDADTYDGTVAKSAKFYYTSDESDSDSISNITLVPDDNYTGTVKLTYIGYNEDGDSFTGTVKITVE